MVMQLAGPPPGEGRGWISAGLDDDLAAPGWIVTGSLHSVHDIGAIRPGVADEAMSRHVLHVCDGGLGQLR